MYVSEDPRRLATPLIVSVMDQPEAEGLQRSCPRATIYETRFQRGVNFIAWLVSKPRSNAASEGLRVSEHTMWARRIHEHLLLSGTNSASDDTHQHSRRRYRRSCRILLRWSTVTPCLSAMRANMMHDALTSWRSLVVPSAAGGGSLWRRFVRGILNAQ